MNINDVKIGKGYWLGEVTEIHKISEYHFVEYIPDDGRVPKCFSVFVNGESINRITHSIESAMAHAIAWKYDGCNSQAAGYFMKMIR
jgi:hypothetical protein